MISGPILGGSPRLRYGTGGVAITGDGNSLMYGMGSTGGQNMTTQLAQLAPINGAINITNVGINGQRTPSMTSDAADVDAAYVPGKINILLAWEGFNHIVGNGATPQQAYDAMATYITAQTAKYPWWVIPITCLPFYGGDGSSQAYLDSSNQLLDQYSALLKANWKSIGCKGVVDVKQAGSVFALPDYQRATMKTLAQYYMLEYDGVSTVSKQVHLNNSGYAKVAAMVANTLRLLPAH